MTKNHSVLFVVLNYNGWRETLTCMDAVLAQTYKQFQVLLIDNGSHDESVSRLEKYSKNPNVTFVKHSKNLGFAGGVNVGISHAIEHDYEYTVLLNNDAIITKDWLSILVRSLEKTQASSITGLLLSGDGKRIESTGDSYSRWGLPFPRQRDEKVSKADESNYVFGGTAGASVYKTTLFRDIGLFDETFFAYFEDTDVNLRAQLAGHKAYYEKTAVAFHDHGTTSSKMPGFTVYQTFKNLPLVFWKDTPLAMLIPTGARFLCVYGLMYVRAVLRGQFGVATRGLFGSIRYFPHALKERRQIQANTKVSSGYLKTVLYPYLPPNNKRYVLRIFHR